MMEFKISLCRITIRVGLKRTIFRVWVLFFELIINTNFKKIKIVNKYNIINELILTNRCHDCI